MLPAAIILLLVYGAFGANPEKPRGIIGQQKLATAVDCSGAVGFSGIGTLKTHQSGLLSYRTTLVDRSVGFSRETGEFTVHCPGVYHIAFAAYGDEPQTRVVLKRRRSSANDTWTEIAAAGGRTSGGGSNQILLELELGDQIGLWLKEGSVQNDRDTRIPSTSLTAFRIAKK